MKNPKPMGAIYLSTCHLPWPNQAFEEHLLLEGPAAMSLYLWQNRRTVVVGKHQNALKEVKLPLLEAEGGFLARRISGGGAVYHDEGNLNFTFVGPKAVYDLPRQTGVICKAMEALGLQAEFSGRNDLLIDGRKFSGNAYCIKGERAFHHGTILIECKLEDMRRYLSPAVEKIKSKGVASVEARVVNLCKLNPALTVSQVKEALCRAFEEEYPVSERLHIDTETAAPQELIDKYSSWEWLYGREPEFEVTLKERFPWGMLELGLTARNGRISQCRVYSDALDNDFLEELMAQLPGLPWHGQELAQALSALPGDGEKRQKYQDVGKWLIRHLSHC